MKKLTSIVLALALALTVVAPVAASAQTASGYTFSTNLTVGSRGEAVTALQHFLESKGLLTIPAGVSKGYFGSLTRSAVAAYQSMKGITPAVGYFGPITRAAANAEGHTLPTGTPGCPVGAMYNSMTGQPCGTPTPVTPGCPAGALYNSMTGQACTPSQTPITSGVEGSLDVRLAASPAANADVQSSTDVPVLGIEFRGKIGDSAVQTVDLKVSVTGTDTENPGSFINTIKVWDGSNLLATIPVNLDTFAKDTSNVYYVRISGLNFLVPKDTTKVLTFTFSTSGNIDTNRTVVVGLYNTTSVRAVSGNGVNSFYGDTAVTLTHTFKKPGNATLTMSGVAAPIKGTNNKIHSTSGAKGVTMLDFNLKSETGTSKVTSVYASTSESGTAPTTLYLYDGSTLLSSKAVSSGNVVFDNLNISISQEQTKTLTVKADWTSSATSGSYASTTIQRVVYEKPTGSSADASGSAVSGSNHFVYTAAPLFTLASAPTITKTTNTTTGSTTDVTAVFKLNVTALGGTMIQFPTNGASTSIVFTNGTTLYDATSISVTSDPNNNLGENGVATVTITALVNNAGLGSDGLYSALVDSISWVVGTTSATQSTSTTNMFDNFKTPESISFTS